MCTATHSVETFFERSQKARVSSTKVLFVRTVVAGLRAHETGLSNSNSFVVSCVTDLFVNTLLHPSEGRLPF